MYSIEIEKLFFLNLNFENKTKLIFTSKFSGNIVVIVWKSCLLGHSVQITTIWKRRSVLIIKFFPSKPTRDTPSKDVWLLYLVEQNISIGFNFDIYKKTYSIDSDMTVDLSSIDDVWSCFEQDFRADSTTFTNCSIVFN